MRSNRARASTLAARLLADLHRSVSVQRAAARQLGLLFTQPAAAAAAETRGKAFEAEVLRRIGNAVP